MTAIESRVGILHISS